MGHHAMAISIERDEMPALDRAASSLKADVANDDVSRRVSRLGIRVGDRVKWAFGRRWTVLAVDGNEAWLKSNDRCASCRRSAPLSQLVLCSPILDIVGDELFDAAT